MPQNVSALAGKYSPWGYEQITGMTSATALTVPTGAHFAIIQAEAQNVRWRDDGTDPTASVGMLLVADQDIFYSGNLNNIRFFEASSGAILNVTYY